MAKTLLNTIRPGDRVTIVTPQGQQRTGRAVMRSAHGGWVLNMGGKHGTPGVADERNIVAVKIRGGSSRNQFGSSASEHTRLAGKAAVEIEHAAALTINKARHGRCTAATMAYAEMQQAIGRYEAHAQSGGKAWKSATVIRDAAYEYNQYCVRESVTVDGRYRRRRR